MLAGLYSAATGMNTAAEQHEIIARNLAHANVPGLPPPGHGVGDFRSGARRRDLTAVGT